MLEDEPYATWALDVRGSYQGRVLGARLDAADAALAELDFAPALVHAEAAAALDGFSERAYRTEMLALYALDRSHEALSRYRAFRGRLDEELGLEPGGETRALESAILRQEDVHSLLPRPIGRSRIEIGGPDVRLLGRDAELDLLVGAAQRGLDDAVLIHVEAEAGLGKSRLLQELTRRLDGVRVGERPARSSSSTCPTFRSPQRSGRRSTASRSTSDEPRRSARSFRSSRPPTPLGQKFEEVEVLEALVAVVADHGPLVLVLDDLQWADPSTLAAIAYMRRRGDGLRVAIVTAAVPRDPLSEAHLRGLAPDTILRLEPLTEAELAPLGMPDLHEATGGHPRAVADVMANGRPASPSRSLTEALLAQCRAEGPRAFRLLTAASVLDQPFDPEPLADLLDTDPTELTEELERLCERRILRIDGLHFRFRYDLVRQALRETISPARERLLHRRLADRQVDVGFRTESRAL